MMMTDDVEPSADSLSDKAAWKRANSDLRGLHNKNLEYIQNLIHRQKAQQEQEAQAVEKSQKLHKNLARHVLGSSWARLGRDQGGAGGPNGGGPDDPDGTSSGVAAEGGVSSPTGAAAGTAWASPSVRTSQSAVPSLPPLMEGPGDAAAGGGGDAGASPRIAGRRAGRRRGGGGGSGVDEVAMMRSSAGPRPTRREGTAGTLRSSTDVSASTSPKKSPRRAVTVGAASTCLALYQQAVTGRMQSESVRSAHDVLVPGGPQAQYTLWRQKQRLSPDQRVFCMAGSGNHTFGVKSTLLSRGWVENSDHNSTNFDLKWAVSPQDVNHGALWEGQIVNHFGRSTCITTKAGLCHTIRQLAWYEAADFRHFFPRCYDLSEAEEKKDFVQDARWNVAESLIKRALANEKLYGTGPVAAASAGAGALDLATLKLALRATAARLAQDMVLIDMDEDLVPAGRTPAAASNNNANNNSASPEESPLTEVEWGKLTLHPALFASPPEPAPLHLDPAWVTTRSFITSALLPRVVVVPRVRRRRNHKGRRPAGAGGDGGATTDASGEGGRTSGGSGSSGSSDEEPASPTAARPPPLPGRRSAPAAEDAEEAGGTAARQASGSEASSSGRGVSPPRAPSRRPGSALGVPLGGGPAAEVDWASVMSLSEAALRPATSDWAAALAAGRALLAAAAVLHPQTHINGMNGVWIVKPGGKSRGRGIRLFNNLNEMFAYIKGGEAQELESRWIVQKYIERPLIISARKFDLRQWVLVTDWNPLAVWFYGDCYLRFAADDYQMDNLDIYQHLCNNSVSKYFDGPHKDDSITAGGNMWSVAQFKEWLTMTYGDGGLWETLVQPAMKHIVICTLKAAQDMVKARKCSCQIYGYDFLIDDQLQVWVLEINSSPTMEASTPVTTLLCASVQEDIVKVIVDLPEQQARAAAAGEKRTLPSEFDTGQFECIVDGGSELRVPPFTGLSLELRGTAYNMGKGAGGSGGNGYAAKGRPTSAGGLPVVRTRGPGGGGGDDGGGGSSANSAPIPACFERLYAAATGNGSVERLHPNSAAVAAVAANRQSLPMGKMSMPLTKAERAAAAAAAAAAAEELADGRAVAATIARGGERGTGRADRSDGASGSSAGAVGSTSGSMPRSLFPPKVRRTSCSSSDPSPLRKRDAASASAASAAASSSSSSATTASKLRFGEDSGAAPSAGGAASSDPTTAGFRGPNGLPVPLSSGFAGISLMPAPTPVCPDFQVPTVLRVNSSFKGKPLSSVPHGVAAASLRASWASTSELEIAQAHSVPLSVMAGGRSGNGGGGGGGNSNTFSGTSNDDLSLSRLMVGGMNLGQRLGSLLKQ